MTKRTSYRNTDPAPSVGYRFDGQVFRTQRDLGAHIAPIVGRSLPVCVSMLRDFGNDAVRVIEHYRQANDLTQFGELAKELRFSCRENGHVNIDELTVLTSENDPYRFDHPTGRINGQWFAEHFNRLVPDATHLRGFHYRLVSSTARVLKPDGSPYRNNDADWVWMMRKASTAARWLGLVPFERILDERNDPPVLPDEEYDRDPDVRPGIWQQLQNGDAADLPDIDDAMPAIRVGHDPHRQPYRIVLFGEKSSLAPVLGPIREMVNGELLLPTGESTTTMVFNLAQRCVDDGRPAVIGYFSDFDPSGWQMGISVARKLQALRTLRFPTLDVRLYPMALNYEQVVALDLPSTPLKDTERRADKWREAWGHEQTEIDALAALNPAELTRIAEDFVRPFYDPTLAARTAAVVRRHRDIAESALAETSQYEASREAIAEALADLEAASGVLGAAQAQAMDDLEDIELPDPPDLPEPAIEATAPEPLFTTDDDYAAAAVKLKRHRALSPALDDC